MPPTDGARKRRSMDLIPERMDGPGLAKSSTMRTIDVSSQRGDWGKRVKRIKGVKVMDLTLSLMLGRHCIG